LTDASASPEAPPESLTGGRLNAAISTDIVRLHSEFYGKGPTKARTYSVDDVVVTVLRNIFTTVEKTLVGAGKEAQVRDVRTTFQTAMADRFKAAVERHTGRRVIAFFSQVDVEAEMAVEAFVLEAPSEDGAGPAA
jgi:uncharacterized protein YbcI